MKLKLILTSIILSLLFACGDGYGDIDSENNHFFNEHKTWIVTQGSDSISLEFGDSYLKGFDLRVYDISGSYPRQRDRLFRETYSSWIQKGKTYFSLHDYIMVTDSLGYEREETANWVEIILRL